jgi:hypothetical protein
VEITLSIIGTAGRKDPDRKENLSKAHFDAMCVVANGLIDQLKESNYPITHLVSGGAAWADHVAVKLFLDKKVPHLRLFLPCAFEGGSFHDTGVRDPKTNPGGTANYYHKLFNNATQINSLTQIAIAKAEGAELINVEKGFHARNALVAKSDFILAMTFGNGAEVKEGGTADTVRMYLDRVHKKGFFDKSFHYNLTDGTIHSGCKAPIKDRTLDEAKKFAKRVGINTNSLIAAHFAP